MTNKIQQTFTINNKTPMVIGGVTIGVGDIVRVRKKVIVKGRYKDRYAVMDKWDRVFCHVTFEQLCELIGRGNASKFLGEYAYE